MGNTAIRVEGLGKQYTIGGAVDKTKTFRESLVDAVAAPYRRLRKVMSGRAATSARTDETFWALQGIDFTIEQGEVVGIIGHNGAGKSTLLKILSRITEPTVGRATLHGRVGALLEVGTGFHPELTGRENVYMNAAILGMSRKEINRKFDEIVDFAEVEQFIETPVKHYSSGMTLRLGFAVAAHLEPEILIVDEVLAVGDASFQRKCLGKMSDVAGEGRTVLFVSHNMAAIANLTARTIVLKKGGIAFDGETARGIEDYMHANTVTQQEGGIVIGKAIDNGITFEALHIRDGQGNPVNAVPVLADVHLAVDLQLLKETNVSVNFALINSVGVRIVSYNNYHVTGEDMRLGPGKTTIVCAIETLLLVPDRYFVEVSIRSGNRTLKKFPNAVALDVLPADVYGNSFVPSTQNGVIVAMNGHWYNQQPEPQRDY